MNIAAQRYADILMVIADEKISTEEVNLLAGKWNLTNIEVLKYIASVTGNVELGKGWDAAGYAAGESWKSALKELNAYLAAVGKGAFVAPTNVPTTNPTNPFTANIEQLDKKNGFLTEKPLVFNGKEVKEFDIVMGNPPFNKGAVRVAMVTSKTRKERKDLGIEEDKSESGFWVKFVNKALNNGVLKPNGFLLFIHPITWFKPDRAGAHDLILSKQILNIKIYKNDGSAQKLFEGKGKISIAYYLLENSKVTEKTRFEYADDKGKKENVLLSIKSIILLNYNSIYNKVVNKCALFGNTDGLKHTTIKQCDDSGKHKLITILEEKGTIKYIKSSVSHPDQNIPKLIVGGTYTPIVLFDKEGDYGLFARGQRHYFIGDGLDKINNYFKTKLSTLILRYVKYEQDFIKPGYFPDIRSIDLETINDDTLADYFGFTVEERREIDQMPIPIHPKADSIIKITCAQLKGEKDKEGGSRPIHRFTRRKRN
jgi:hypothetical protein